MHITINKTQSLLFPQIADKIKNLQFENRDAVMRERTFLVHKFCHPDLSAINGVRIKDYTATYDAIRVKCERIGISEELEVYKAENECLFFVDSGTWRYDHCHYAVYLS